MGIVGLEEFPCFAYGRHPSGARRVPMYNSAFCGQWSGDSNPYYDNSVCDGNSGPLFVVEAPFGGDANEVRKRKLDGMKGEVITSGERNARNVPVGVGSQSGTSSSSSKPVLAPVRSSEATPATRLAEKLRVHPAELKHSSSSTAAGRSSHPRVISIPVMPMDAGIDNIVKCNVISQEGTKKLRKAMSAERAAVLIQAWYRGILVRNTQPLAQLRQIAKVKSQFEEFEGKASDADFINYARESSAARVRLTEGIMKLLLQLDAIQGAHPIVREIRKLATKEVISLQGRVDALLSRDASAVESSDLAMETEQASGEDTMEEMVAPTESTASDSRATPMVAVDEKRETRMQMAESDPAEGRLESVELEACRGDEVLANEANDSWSIRMSGPDQDDRDVDFEKSEASLKPIESEEVEPESIEVDKSASDEMKRVECESDEAAKAGERHESVVENESFLNSRHEDGEKVEEVSLAHAELIPEAIEVATVEVNNVEVNSSDEGAHHSGNVSDASRHGTLQRNEEEIEGVDDSINGNIVHANRDFSDGDGDLVHRLNEKGSLLPYSPRSPLEALESLGFPESISDSELQSELQTSLDLRKDGPTEGKPDTGALLLKLSEENKALKSLLITVMKWNQMQATTMQEVNQRLGKLESKVLPRIDKKLNSRRRGSNKYSPMML